MDLQTGRHRVSSMILEQYKISVIALQAACCSSNLVTDVYTMASRCTGDTVVDQSILNSNLANICTLDVLNKTRSDVSHVTACLTWWSEFLATDPEVQGSIF
jgi:hypothetical protein